MRKYLRLGTTLGPKVVRQLRWINKYSKHPEKTDFAVRYAQVHKFLESAMKNFRVKFIVGGMENIPNDTNVVFTPNHQSFMDPVIMLGLFEHPLSFLSKVEVIKFPIIGKIVKALDGVFMDRKNIRDEIKAIGKVSDMLENEKRVSVFIFPEGTRSKTLEIADFKAGALKPAYNAEVPIVPVAIYGTFRILDTKTHFKKYPIQIQFLKPHLPSEFETIPTTEMAAIVRNEVLAEVEKMKIRDEELVKKYK